MLNRVTGNRPSIQGIKAALAAGRLSHSILLTGEKGTGTGFAARCLAADYLWPHGGDGARLEIMTRPVMEDPEKTPARTGLIHMAFSVGSRERVEELTARLKEDGYQVLSGPRTTGDGYYESCVVGIEGNQIEITI